MNDGSCIRLRPERANHVWSYDFVSGKTHDGRGLRVLTLIDEYTRECLAIRVARRLGRYEVIEALTDVMLYRGIPEHIRSDNGPEFVAEELRKWLVKVGTGTLYIEPGSPWENNYCERFNGKLRDECLNGEIFYSLKEAQVVIAKWRVLYNTLRPHSALGYRPPAPAAMAPQMAALRSPTAPCDPPFASLPDEVVSTVAICSQRQTGRDTVQLSDHDYLGEFSRLAPYTITFPSTTFATYPPPLKNCITFLPARAISAQRDFVSGFCSRARTSRPSKTKSACRKPRLGVRRTG